MNLTNHTWLKRADNFRLLGIDFNNKLRGMENNFKAQLDKMRKEMFAWYRVRLSNEEKALVVKTHGLSKFTHIAMIMEDPPKKTIKEIENMICRFIQAGNYRTTRELIFLPKDLGGLGIPRVREF